MGTGPTPRKYPTRLGVVMLQPSQSTLTIHRGGRHRCSCPSPTAPLSPSLDRRDHAAVAVGGRSLSPD